MEREGHRKNMAREKERGFGMEKSDAMTKRDGMAKSDATTEGEGMTENAGTIHGASAFENPGDGQGSGETLPEAGRAGEGKDAPSPPVREEGFGGFSGSLAKEVALRVSLWAVLLMVVITGLGYWTLFAAREEQTLENLADFAAGRVESERFLFDLARDDLRILAEEFLDLYRSDVSFSEEEFWTYFFRDDEGAVRLRRKYFDGTAPAKGLLFRGISAFVGNNQKTLDEDFRRRLLLSYFLVTRLGPAWIDRFANVYVSMPENGMVIYWPEEPWGLTARADLVMTDGSVIKSTLQEFNPERKPGWTGLYYDLTAEHWMITYQLPVDYEGRHLVTPGVDVTLDDLMERLVARKMDDTEGAYNFVVTSDGKLVAHPDRLHKAKEERGILSIDKLDDPDLAAQYALVSANAPGEGEAPRIVRDERRDLYLAVARMPGPEWFFVAAYPRAELLARAHESARLVLVFGVLLFLAFMVVVTLVLRRSVAEPLGVLRNVSGALSRGEYAALSCGAFQAVASARNEVGLLGRAFRDMGFAVRDASRLLEEKIAARTGELAAANLKLEELSFRDGLTGIYNRRAFDRDLDEAFRRALLGQGGFALVLCDVDWFKPYNDTYGHDEGDRVLREIARVMTENVGACGDVYRYGGEELLVILRGADGDDARHAAERLLAEVRALGIPHAASPHGIVTVSAGVGVFSPEYQFPGEMVREVDGRMYLAKAGGRNRVTA